MDPLRRIDLNLLLALHHLLEGASVQRAAAELGVGQPAMSASLARLREVLGDPLLIRSGRGMRRTDRAEALRGPVADLVGLTRRVLAEVAPFDPARDEWTARVALSDEARGWLGPRLVARVQAEAPRVDLRLRPITMDSTRAGVSGEIDLAVFPDPVGSAISLAPDLDPFVVRPLLTTAFALVTSAAHPVTTWSLASYAAAHHVLVVPWGGVDRGFADEVLAQHGLSRRIAVTVPTFAEALALVAAGPSLVTLAPRLVAAGPALRCAPLPWGERKLRICYAFHPRTSRNPRLRWLVRVIEELAGEAPG